MTTMRVPLITAAEITRAGVGQTLLEEATPGLGLRIGKRKSSWYLRRMWSGTQRSLKLGEYPAVLPPEARAMAETASVAISRGDDPRQHLRRSDISLDDLIELWIADKPTSGKHRQKWARAIRRRCAVLLGTPIIHITTRALSEIVESLRPRKPAAAYDLAKRLAAVFRFAVETGLLATSPTQRLDQGRTASRERVPTLTELRRIWDASEGWPAHFRAMVRLIMLTAARRGEAGAIGWQDYDRQARKLTIRGATSKTGSAMTLPVPEELAAELARLPSRDIGPLVCLPGGRAFDSNAFDHGLNARLRSLFPNDPIKLHDFRRAVATRCSERGWGREMIDAQLNHSASVTSSVVSNAYFRTTQLDQRREMMADFAGAVSGSQNISKSAP